MQKTNSSPYAGRIWCRTQDGCAYTFEEYLRLLESFHGHAAPGLLIGGKMVDIAAARLPPGQLFDAICETPKCLPDAVQLLTPCTIGNGWLKIVHLGRFALALYDKYKGSGIRVFLDSTKLAPGSEIRTWFFKLKPKPQQNKARLFEEIRQAGANLLSVQPVRIRPSFLKKNEPAKKILCPMCGESYPANHGPICRGCQGENPYDDFTLISAAAPSPLCMGK